MLINNCECHVCGNKFHRKPYGIKRAIRHFCSKKCGWIGKRNKIEMSCKYCGSKYMVIPSRFKRNSGYFCSQSCSSKFLNPKGMLNPRFKQLTRKCEICGTEFRAKMCRVKKGLARYCSKICLGKYQTGSNSTNWKGGMTEKNSIIRSSKKYARWRFEVFKRDGFKCVECGDNRGHNLNADHLLPFSQFPEFRFELWNGKTLCINCHKKTPTFGRKVNSLFKFQKV